MSSQRKSRKQQYMSSEEDYESGDADDSDDVEPNKARRSSRRPKEALVSRQQRKKVAKYDADTTVEEEKLLQQALKNSLKEVCRVEHVIPLAPTMRPTHEEFKDPVKYIASIQDECAQYGMCLVIPPDGWNPPFCIDMNGDNRFTTRTQAVHTLQEARDDGFLEGNSYTYGEYKAVAETFKSTWLMNEYKCDFEPSFDDLEKEYWRMVETGLPTATVEYGNDIDSAIFGSGFPRGYARKDDVLDANELRLVSDQLGVIERGDMKTVEYYKCTGWNLQNIALSSGSLLQYQTEPITGINSPWLYLGMLFTSFCWHTEDNYLYSINYSHHGHKQWYCVPGVHAGEFDKAVKESHFIAYKEDPNFIYDITTQFSPSFLKSRGVPVYQVRQQPRSFIITFPRAYHAGFNYEFNCNEACNFAIPAWLPIGRISIEKYRTSARLSPFSFVRLLFTLAHNFKKITTAEDKVVELIAVLDREIAERNIMHVNGIINILDDKAKFPKTDFTLMTKEGMDYDDKRTCFLCKYVCVMSAIACQCDKTRVACCHHHKHMCDCPNSSKWLIAWFSMRDLQDLLSRLHIDLSRCVAETNRCVGLAASSSSARIALNTIEYAIQGADIL